MGRRKKLIKNKNKKYIKKTKKYSQKDKEIEEYNDEQEDDDEPLVHDELREYSIKRKNRELKKRKKKRRIITLIVIVLLGIIIYFNWNILAPASVADSVQGFFSGFSKNYFPVEFNDGKLSKSVAVGQNIGVLTDTSYIIYSKNGEKLDTRPHGMNNPGAVSGGGKALIFDRGGKTFAVESRFKEELSSETKENITSASIGSNAYFSIVTESENYLSEVLVFNNSCKQIFKWDSIQGRIVSTAISPDGKTLAAALIGVRSGNIYTDIYFYDMTSDKPKAVKKYDNTLIHSLNFTDGGHVSAVGDQAIYFVDTKGSQINTYDYSDRELAAFENAGDTPVLVFKKGTSQSTVVSFEKDGKKKGETTGNFSNVKSVDYGSSKIMVLSDETVWCFDTNCQNNTKLKTTQDSKLVIANNNSAYIFKTQSIDKITLK